MGTALAHRLRAAGVNVVGPFGRGASGEGADIVLLAVPDAQISAAAALIARGPAVGHLSGATGLDVLAPHPAFSLHPLTTVVRPEHVFSGGYAAVDGSSEQTVRVAEQLAAALELRVFRVREEDRTAYHAAAAIASNFLVTVEGLAEALAATAGVPRATFVPLVRAAVDNWASNGAASALTGPIARGDVATVAKHRRAIQERIPDALPLFDALAEATQRLAIAPQSGETP